MPPTQERAERELVLQIALGTPLMSTKGLGAPDVEAAYSRAWEICQGECDKPELFPVLWGLWSFYLARADWPRTRDLGNRFLTLAEEEQDEDLLMEAHRGLAATFMHLGQFGAALDHAEQGIALYDPRRHHEHAFLFGHDPGVVSLLYAAHVLWTLGYPDQGLARLQEALDLARDLDHPVSVALAQGHAASHYYLRRESRPALQAAQAAIDVSTEHGFPLWLALGSILRGWVLTEQGQVEEGIAAMRRAWASWRATGAKMERPAIATILADVYGQQGEVAEGLTSIDQALDLMEETNERWWEAEALRVKGQLLFVQSESASSDDMRNVEACFRRAIEVAQRREAKVWELRATVDLSRLLRRQGRRNEAQRALSDIYGWFTEGLETPDLVKAKHLLEELRDESGTV
jgi:predicted ATPase